MKGPRVTLALIRLTALAVIVVIAAIVVMIVGTEGMRELLEDAADSRWGALAFVVVYVIGVVLMVPGTIGTLASGAVLGFAVGFPVAVVSALIGATIAFFVSRAVGREGMNQLLGDRMASTDEWLMENDFLSILILRLMPIVPFNVLNYAAGLSSVRASRYMWATLIGITPGTALTSFAASRADEPSSATFIGSAIALVAVVLVSAGFARRFSASRRTA